MYLEESFGRHVMISLSRICRRGLCCSIEGTTPAAARLSTHDKIEVSEWLEPDGLSIDRAAQQVLEANVRFGSKADISECPSDVRFTPKSRHWNSAA
jgi:hypothetical protein